MPIKPQLIKPKKSNTTQPLNDTSYELSTHSCYPIEEQPEAPKDKTSKPLSDNLVEATTDNPKKASKKALIDNVIEITDI